MDHADPESGPGRPGAHPLREWDPWWEAAWLTVGTAFRTAFKVRVEGDSEIPARGGALLAYNHVSVLDPIAVALAAARRGRPVRFMALSELFEHGLMGWALRTT